MLMAAGNEIEVGQRRLERRLQKFVEGERGLITTKRRWFVPATAARIDEVNFYRPGVLQWVGMNDSSAGRPDVCAFTFLEEGFTVYTSRLR